MTVRLSKWILYSPVAVLPFLAAMVVSTGPAVEDVASRARASLAASGATWASVSLDGRDARLSGDAPDSESIDKAIAAVAGTYGVRRVEAAARVVAPPKVELTAPVIHALTAGPGRILVTGTWQEGVAASLKAMLADKTWTLGEGPVLVSGGKGNWRLTPDIELAPGTHDLVIEVIGPGGEVLRDSTTGEITILPPPPEMAAPTVESLDTNDARPVIRGTWPSAVARTLKVIVGQVAYVLGSAPELTHDADRWSLALSSPLGDGAYDIQVEVSDELGRIAATAAPGKFTIDTVPPAGPVIAPIGGGDLPLSITGTWAEGDAVSLAARLAGRVWSLGADAALSSDGKGNWNFAPDIELPPGTYDIEIEVADRAGNIARDSSKDEIVIAAPPPPQMQAPAVIAAVETAARPVVRGTWPEIAASSLSVTLGGSQYVLGRDEALTSDGIGNWSFAVPVPLQDGIYDVVVEAGDASGKTMADTTRDELTIDAAAPAAPTVALYSGEESPDRLTGTWAWPDAVSLMVSIPAAGIAARLGDGHLTSSSGGWTLKLARPLAPGSYDVVVETPDSRGRIATDQTRFEILVKEPPPSPPPPPPPPLKAPTVAAYAGVAVPAALNGTWDEGQATALNVAIPAAGIAAMLGHDPALVSDGSGNWSLALPPSLAPGRYDVTVEISDGKARSASETITGALDIKEPPSPPPPYDCAGTLDLIGETFPIRFAFDSPEIVPPYDASVAQVAALLNDPRCVSMKAEVQGHADYFGGRLYNTALSLARAQTVMNHLAAAGVAANRLSVAGQGKARPSDPARNRDARSRNRRVEVRVKE